jgi:hypothetical protein
MKAILKWEKPTSVINIWSFLGLTRYYRRFIEGLSMIAIPFTPLTPKGSEVWVDWKMWKYFPRVKEEAYNCSYFCTSIMIKRVYGL